MSRKIAASKRFSGLVLKNSINQTIHGYCRGQKYETIPIKNTQFRAIEIFQ
jgi:hypothetical protein